MLARHETRRVMFPRRGSFLASRIRSHVRDDRDVGSIADQRIQDPPSCSIESEIWIVGYPAKLSRETAPRDKGRRRRSEGASVVQVARRPSSSPGLLLEQEHPAGDLEQVLAGAWSR
jgi:hypothetical protein